MNSISFNLSGKIDKQTVEVLSIVKGIADSLGVRSFIVGAIARDLVLKYCYGTESTRRTEDIDFGVEVVDWNEFEKLTKALLETGKFFSTRQKHRFLFDRIFIDIVPFGQITDENLRLSWPPEHETIMSMVGFEEAYVNSLVLRLSSDPDLDIRVPSIPGLALLKMISWDDGERERDAEDLYFILRNYEGAGNTERLYGKEQEILIEESFDTEAAGVRLLGRDMAKIAEPETFKTLMRIVETGITEEGGFKLALSITRNIPLSRSDENKFERVLLLLGKLKQGLTEGKAT